MIEENSPLVFDIKRGSIDDGPGIRTVVFLKGCPLRCVWCHNPEGMSTEQEYFYYEPRCIGCGGCGSCGGDCPANALITVGKSYGKQELINILLEDRAYYSVSGGGVTFSGGEPLMYMEYIGEIAKRLAAEGIDVAVETSGYFDFEAFTALVLPYISCLLYDIKLFDRLEHVKYTGADNAVILENIKRLAGQVRIIPRTPLIPGITDTEENLLNISELLKGYGIKGHITLPYNDAGERKRKLLADGNARMQAYE